MKKSHSLCRSELRRCALYEAAHQARKSRPEEMGESRAPIVFNPVNRVVVQDSQQTDYQTEHYRNGRKRRSWPRPAFSEPDEPQQSQ